MKRNQELDKAYTSFIGDLKLLVEQSRDFSTSYKKQLKEIDKEFKKKQLDPKKRSITERVKAGEDDFVGEFKENVNHLFDKGNDLARVQTLSNNGIFLYCIALFENYASKVVKINFKDGGSGKDSPKKKYIQKFQAFALERSKNNNNSFLFLSPAKMRDNYDELPDKIELWTYMLGIEKKGLFHFSRLKYTEIRERRNLLVHRSVFIDERYKKSFKKANMESDKGKKANKFLDLIISRYSKQSKEDIKRKRIDMSVSPLYLIYVFGTLLEMASLLYMYSFELSKEEIEGDIFPENFMHDYLMLFSFNIDNPGILSTIEDIVIEYLENIADYDWNNIPTIDKFNLLIVKVAILDSKKYTFSLVKKLYQNENRKKFIDLYEKEVANTEKDLFTKRDEIIPTIKKNKENRDLIELIASHIDGDIDNIINIAKKLKLTFKSIDDWFMFKKYEKNKKFIAFKKTLNKDKEQGIHKVRVKTK